MAKSEISNSKGFSRMCRITFIIGNGFDLKLNLKTRYTDVYKGYVNIPSKSMVITKFKNSLNMDKKYNFDRWSDFEMGMAEYSKSLFSENELIECVRDFKGYMVDYLKKENDKFVDMVLNTNSDTQVRKFMKSIDSFYTGLTQNDINIIQDIISTKVIYRDYIVFNYTTTLDTLLSLYSRYEGEIENEPIHIHGRLDKDVVLGIDNIEQIKSSNFLLSKKGKRAFVKTIFNEQYDVSRVDAAKESIVNSDIICVYGFSMGASDKMWVDLLATWLIDNPNHHIVIFQYDKTKYHSYNRDEMMDVEDEKKDFIMKKLGIKNEAISNQIHIPIGVDLFDFSWQLPTVRPIEEVFA